MRLKKSKSNGSGNDSPYGEELREGAHPVRIQYYEGDVEYDFDGPIPKENNNERNSDRTDASSEEVTTMKILGRGDTSGDGRSRSRMLIIVGLCLLLGGVIATSVILAKKSSKREQKIDKSTTSTGTESPTAAPTTTARYGQFYDLATLISAAEHLDDESSGQSQALYWLVYDDPASISLDTTLAIDVLERYAIASLYFATDGDNSWASLNDGSSFLSADSVCNWNNVSGDESGVFCNANGSVDRISIVSNGLSGTIPPELNHLTDLTTLHLYYNELEGSVPDLDQLTLLESLDIDGNNLSGSMPASIFTLPELQYLFMGSNHDLTGTIPEFSTESKLEAISFYNCSLSGSIPASMASSQTLRRVQFFSNGLTGPIPSSLTSLPGLETLGLRDNELTGTLPAFAGQANLQSISVGENSLDGALPVLEDLDALEILFAQGNQFVGTIPTFLGALPSLKRLWLSDNQFEGTLPRLSANPNTLSLAYFDGNQLTGDMEEFFQTAPTTLVWVDVSNNNLGGSISANIERLAWLTIFRASNCSLSGNLPTELGSLFYAETLDFSENQLQGQIPAVLGDLPSLSHLDLSNNNFGGSVPSRLGKLAPILEVLSLEENSITGDLSSLFCTTEDQPTVLTADCGGDAAEIDCSCCSQCFP